MENRKDELENMEIVLDRILKLCEGDEEYLEMFQDGLDYILDEMLSNDAFGTEGQCDPRGDMREEEWSMYNVQEKP